MAARQPAGAYLEFPKSPIVITYEFSDSEEFEEPVQPIQQVVVPSDPFLIPPGKGEEITMEEAKRRFRMCAETTGSYRNLKVTRPPPPDSGIESSTEPPLLLASSSDSHQPGAQNLNENQPLLPNNDPLSSMTMLERLRHRVQQLTQSWYFIIVLLLFLVCPGSYLYIGGAFFEQCKALKYFPVLFLLLGVSSFLFILTRIFRHVDQLQKLEGNTSLSTYVGALAIIVFAIVYFVEIGFYFTVDFTKHAECSLFLTLVRHSLWITPLVVIVLMFIYCKVRVSGPPIV